jgi:hypothetical protein
MTCPENKDELFVLAQYSTGFRFVTLIQEFIILALRRHLKKTVTHKINTYLGSLAPLMNVTRHESFNDVT